MRKGQAVAVPDGNVHDARGCQLFNQLGPERRRFRGAAPQARATTPGVHLGQADRTRAVRGPQRAPFSHILLRLSTNNTNPTEVIKTPLNQ